MRPILLGFYTFFMIGTSIDGQAVPKGGADLCARILSIDGKLLNGAVKRSEVKLVLRKVFAKEEREILVFRFQREGWLEPKQTGRPFKGEHSGQFGLRYVFINSVSNQIIWQMDEASRDVPSFFALSPVNPNVGFVVKTVQQLYLPGDAPREAQYDQEYRFNKLFSRFMTEVLELSPGEKGRVRIRDLFTTNESINHIELSEDGRMLSIFKSFGKIDIKLE